MVDDVVYVGPRVLQGVALGGRYGDGQVFLVRLGGSRLSGLRVQREVMRADEKVDRTSRVGVSR